MCVSVHVHLYRFVSMQVYNIIVLVLKTIRITKLYKHVRINIHYTKRNLNISNIHCFFILIQLNVNTYHTIQKNTTLPDCRAVFHIISLVPYYPR